MIKLILKTIGVMLLVAIVFPLCVILLSLLPAYLSSLLKVNVFYQYGIALILFLSEIIGILYFIENWKKTLKKKNCG